MVDKFQNAPHKVQLHVERRIEQLTRRLRRPHWHPAHWLRTARSLIPYMSHLQATQLIEGARAGGHTALWSKV